MVRSYRNSALAALVAVSLLTTACGGGRSTSLAPVTPQTAGPSGSTGTSSTLAPGFAYDATTLGKSTLVGPAAFNALTIDVGLTMKDAAGLSRYAAEVSDPKSGTYRHFLTPDQIADRFSATVYDRDGAVAYFKSHGLRVGGWRQRMMLSVRGMQSNLEAAFHTKFGVYRSPAGERFFGPMTPPHVDSGIAVAGSPNIVRRPKRYDVSLVTSRGTENGYSPQQMAAAFDYAGAYNAGYTGRGITVGIVGTGPVQTSTGGRIGDAEAFKEIYGVSGSSFVSLISSSSTDPVVNSASGFSSPPPVTAPCTTPTSDPQPPSLFPTSTCNPEDGEAQLDTEQAASLARDSTVEFYLAYNPNDYCGSSEQIGSPCPAGSGVAAQGLAESDEELQTVIDHDTSDVISMSFGGAEFTQVGSPSPPYEFSSDGSGLDPTEFAMMTAEGIAVFASSGDEGANECQVYAAYGPPNVNGACVSYPSTDPNVSAVGGVTVPLNSSGAQIGPITAWGLQTSYGTDGTGGGVSQYFTLPSYQAGLPGIIGSTRNVPDEALLGDPATGVALLAYADQSFGGAALEQIGGTSVASPQMAAMWALVLQACKQSTTCSAKGSGAYPYRLGNPNPLLYGIYGNTQQYATTFLPVTYGNNALAIYCYYNSATDPANCPTPAPGTSPTPLPNPVPLASGYSANAAGGYNNLTGIGVPFARALIKSVVGV